MDYVAKLQTWFENEKANNGLVDLKLFPGIAGLSANEFARITLEILTGVIPSEPLDTTDL